MAERTRKTTKTVSKLVSAPKTIGRRKKTTTPKPWVNFFSSLKIKVNSFRQKLVALPHWQKLSLLTVILLILLGVYFKNLVVVALVNGQPLTRLQIVGQLEKQGGQKALDDLVTKTLILQEGKKHNILISKADIDAQMKKFEDSVSAQGASFDEALTSQGLTRESLRDNILLNKTIEKLIEKDIKVTDKEVDEYLAQNKDTLPKDASPEALRKQASDSIKNSQQSQKAQELVAKLKKDAHINYFIKY